MIKGIDFFCGAGGLTRGLLDSGIQILAGVDNDGRLEDTYQRNNTPSKFVNKSIKDIDIDTLRNEIGITKNDVVLYAACTPCQPFSTLNRMKGEDDRKDLLLSFAEIVKKSPPDYIVVENVPGLSSAYGRDIYQRFMEVLSVCGFDDVFQERIDAVDYGVPQYRKRFIMLASRRRPLKHPERAAERSGVGQFLRKYPPINDGETSDIYKNHQARKLPLHLKAIVKAVPKDGGNRKDVKDKSILLKCHQDKPDVHRNVFGRMAWEKPAPTLTARCTDVYCGRFTHPEQDRGISLREAAALQTFKDDYIFYGSPFHIQRQIGNAVPVELARRLGQAIITSYLTWLQSKDFNRRNINVEHGK